MQVELTMPSAGDMTLEKQEGGTITLNPTFFGGECAGPHIRVTYTDDQGAAQDDRYRIKIRANGRIELKKADA